MAKTSIEITLDGDETEGSRTMRVYALNGQIVIEKTLNNTNTTIEVNQLENGAYLYEVFAVEIVVR